MDGFGTIHSPAGGHDAGFNFAVRHFNNGSITSGSFSYNDSSSGVSFSGQRISGLTFIGFNHARFTGIAKLGKKAYSFTVDAFDIGPNGAGDQFSITISNGYSASGALTSGDIDIGSCTE